MSTSTPSQAARQPRPSGSSSSLSSITSDLSRPALAGLLFLYITALHLIGLHTFTQGFLLTRLTIPSVSPAYTVSSPAPIPPTHSKAIILVIDALRTDFISPVHPNPASPFHHGVLSLPAELSAARPDHSLIFNTFSDPPTSTMQRIKGITTGSLPTFIDVGANFASTAIEEDSLISQLVAHNRTLAFMGDDTWSHLFPGSFALSHPYDSFNVEDLHTVDNGVVEHLIPYLQPANASRWDVLVGHFLGVDHVGHRVGPERETMRLKLKQMDEVLRQVVRLMDEETLLVVLGDHGMDPKGNHGGDGEMETAAGLWMYSKGSALRGDLAQASRGISWPTYTFPGTTKPLRHLNQIDLVPTLALLLGVPIPFNNLGAVIPECFSRSAEELELATSINARQIRRYIAEYGDENIESAVSDAWTRVESASGSTQSTAANRAYALRALEQLRSLWAQFSLSRIVFGLAVLGLSIPVLVTLYIGVRNSSVAWDTFARMAIETVLMASFTVPFVPATIAFAMTRELRLVAQTFFVSAALASELALILPLLIRPAIPALSSLHVQRWIGPAICLAHSLAFASNSFIMWEDRMVLFLLGTIPVIHIIKSFIAPTASMRLRLLGLSAAFIVITRLVGTITVCREEQQPYCRVTFFSGSLPVAPAWALTLIIPLATQIPRGLAMLLSSTKSLAGPARFLLGIAWRLILVANAGYWLLEFAESWDGLQPQAVPYVQLLKLWIARLSFGGTLLVLPYSLITSPLCITIERGVAQTGEARPVTVLGFANAFGSTYLLFLLIPFALVHTVSQPMAQIALSAILAALLIHLEVVDIQRDAILMLRQFANSAAPGAFEPGQSNVLVRPSFTDVVPLVLLGFLGFFATGHQAVLTSIQWKAAFVGFAEVTYPWSPLLVALNTWGPFILSALAVPLLAIWNVSPRPQGSIPVLAHALQLALAFITYHTATTFASALCAAWLRRHLMVWKVFAPRFMLAGVTLLVVDLAVAMGVLAGLGLTSWKVWRTFKCESI